LSRLLLARDWAPGEKAVLEKELTQFRTTYSADPSAAKQLISVGESCINSSRPPEELAAWMLVASSALNLDATLNK
jgi:hypothetical protein